VEAAAGTVISAGTVGTAAVTAGAAGDVGAGRVDSAVGRTVRTDKGVSLY